jgi:TIR domain
MGGIRSYFHGESGSVLALKWNAYHDDNNLSYVMALRGDPHRIAAYDYGSDIGIDPLIKPGDRVVYVRMDSTCGIWVKDGYQLTPELDGALDRVLQNRKKSLRYMNLYEISPTLAKVWAKTLPYRTGISLEFPIGETPDRASLPATEASVFLSHSGRNALAARFLYEGLKEDGKVQVWLDLAYASESPHHEERISEWLKTALFSCQIFVVLLTRASVASQWVQREIDWAVEKAGKDENFHLVLLNFEGVTVPRPAIEAQFTVDCEGLEFGEIKEELYAAVYRRMGWRAWFEEQKKRGWHKRGTRQHGYEHLMSDGGTAIALHWIEDGDSFRWVLEFETDGVRKQATGRGPWQIVDIDIRPRDPVGCFNLGLWNPIWMRSNDLTLRTGDVGTKYQEKVGKADKWFLTHSLEPRVAQKT